MAPHQSPTSSHYRRRPTPRAALRELLEATLDWAGGGIADRQLLVAGTSYRLTHLADGAAGAAALLCEAPPGAPIPEYLERRRIRDLTDDSVGRHLMIFTDTGHSTLVWSWITRGELGTRVYRELSFTPGQAWGPLRPVLESIAAGSPPLPSRGVSRSRGRRGRHVGSGATLAADVKRPTARALLAAITEAVASGDQVPGRCAAAQMVQDLVEGATECGIIREHWAALLGIRTLDPACGDGEWLERALDVLVPAYEAVLERMRSAVDDLGRRKPAPRAERLGDLRRLVRRSGGWRDPAARRKFATELALLHNMFGAGDRSGRITACRARLVRRLGEAANADLLALNVRVAASSSPERPALRTTSTAGAPADAADGEVIDIVRRGHATLLAMHLESEMDAAELGRAMAAAERRLPPLTGPLLTPGHLIERAS